jgi:hypothetical protein
MAAFGGPSPGTAFFLEKCKLQRKQVETCCETSFKAAGPSKISPKSYQEFSSRKA